MDRDDVEPSNWVYKSFNGVPELLRRTMAKRLQAMGLQKYHNGFSVACHPDELNKPLKWHKPRTVFVNSMSDLFHRDVPDSFIRAVFDIMKRCPQHIFQVLTKRPRRALALDNELLWSPNIWLGVSVEDRRRIQRIRLLQETAAQVKFLSLEPLLGPLLDLPLSGIDWVIAGGESGPRARQLSKQWVVDIRDQCQCASVPFFFKQWGGKNKKKAGRTLDGRTYDEMPGRVIAA